MKKKLLIIDDNKSFSQSMEQMLQDEYYVRSAFNGKEALTILEDAEFHVILLDIRLGNESGQDVLLQIKQTAPDIPVIMLTGFGSIESAVNCIKLGAFDYLQKPIKYEKLKIILQNAESLTLLKSENLQLRSMIDGQGPIIESNDKAFLDLLSTAKRLAASKIPFLITGENGVGKEVLADYIHSQSTRCYKTLMKFNCAAFPENLLDNELFGHEKGAYTGATSVYKGVFERAHKGTLFLDEIGDMSLSVQAKVLRVLQNGELYRLGGKEKICVDIQFISATNKNLKDQIEKKLFREDLYYRLNAATLRIPPLRERRCDIPLLSRQFLNEFCSESGKSITGFTEEVLSLFEKSEWPGNIRQLKNTIAFAVAISQDSKIGLQDLPPEFDREQENPPGRNVFDISEKALILRELERQGYNKKKAAETLNISRSTLYSKMKKYEIQ